MGADEAGAEAGRDRLLVRTLPPSRAVTGTAQEVIDRIAEYHGSGRDGLNIAFRRLHDWDAFEAYIEQVLPVIIGREQERGGSSPCLIDSKCHLPIRCASQSALRQTTIFRNGLSSEHTAIM